MFVAQRLMLLIPDYRTYKEFWHNFKFLIAECQKIGIYNPENYKQNPKMYCGLTTDSPYSVLSICSYYTSIYWNTLN